MFSFLLAFVQDPQVALLLKKKKERERERERNARAQVSAYYRERSGKRGESKMADRPLVAGSIEVALGGRAYRESNLARRRKVGGHACDRCRRLDAVSSGARTAKRNMKLSRVRGALAVPPRSFFSG
jgi:hypothetical protein